MLGIPSTTATIEKRPKTIPEFSSNLTHFLKRHAKRPPNAADAIAIDMPTSDSETTASCDPSTGTAVNIEVSVTPPMTTRTPAAEIILKSYFSSSMENMNAKTVEVA